MPMDDIVKEFFDYEHFTKLFDYFKDHTEFVCSCCKNEIECKGKECPCYQNLGNKLYDKETGQPFIYNGDFTCMDLDFSECEFYDGTKCRECIKSNDISGFEWNGKVE